MLIVSWVCFINYKLLYIHFDYQFILLRNVQMLRKLSKIKIKERIFRVLVVAEFLSNICCDQTSSIQELWQNIWI